MHLPLILYKTKYFDSEQYWYLPFHLFKIIDENGFKILNSTQVHYNGIRYTRYQQILMGIPLHLWLKKLYSRSESCYICVAEWKWITLKNGLSPSMYPKCKWLKCSISTLVYRNLGQAA